MARKKMTLSMDEKLKSLIAAATDEKLFDWTDPKMVGRAYGYLDKVESITLVDGQEIVALAHGTNDYYTRVFMGKGGDLESECSCPVGHRCKHAVAVILNVAKRISDGVCIAENTSDCEIWKAAESALAVAKAKIEERERKILEQRQAKEREEEEYRQRMERRRKETLASFGAFLERMRDCKSRGDYDTVLKILDEACKNTDDDFDIEPYGSELYDMIEEMSKVAVEVLKCCKMSDTEKILFVHDAETPYRYYVSPRFLYDEYWKEENATKFPVDVWHEVGDSLKSRLDDEAFVEGCGYHKLCFTVEGACEAYWRADGGKVAFALRKRFAAKTDGWESCADDLCRLGRRDEAKKFLLESRDFVRSPENDEWEDGHNLIEKLAEIYAGEGNFAYAAALLAENWLALVGGLNHCGDQYGLERVLDMAGKAGCRQEMFQAVAHEVDAGYPLRARMYKNGQEPAVEPSTWPLPPTGLNLDIQRPLFSIDAHWWEAEAVLIRVAVKEGLLDEAAKRYLNLPPRPGGYFGVSCEDQLTDFEREVQKALADKFPKVACSIAATQEFRSWAASHPGEKVPKELKERLFPLMNVCSSHRVAGRGPGGKKHLN